MDVNVKDIAHECIKDWPVEGHGESWHENAHEESLIDGTHPDDEMRIFRRVAEENVVEAMQKWASSCLGGDSIPEDLDPRIDLYQSKDGIHWNWKLKDENGEQWGPDVGPFKSAGWAAKDAGWYLEWLKEKNKADRLEKEIAELREKHLTPVAPPEPDSPSCRNCGEPITKAIRDDNDGWCYNCAPR